MSKYKYFNETDWECKCGCGFDVTDELKELCDRARGLAGVPFIINSGARCLEHNRSIGSRDTSSHTKGLAVDIMAKSSREMSLIFDSLTSVGFTRRGINFKDKFIHVDLDRDKSQQVIFGY